MQRCHFNLQVEHFCTFQGHSGAIRGVVSKKGYPEFLTVSEDLSLRCWTWEKGNTLPHSTLKAVNDKLGRLSAKYKYKIRKQL